MTDMPEILTRFDGWLAEASAHPHIKEPTAMSLATVDARGMPSVRMVLLKGHDARGFVFYTNEQSRKGHELAKNAQAALCFYWMPLGRQIRITGAVEDVSAAEADAYFASRSRESQIGAWASKQSETLDSRDTLMGRFAEYEQKFASHPVPRPPHWRGWRVVPQEIEFWQEGAHRLHERDVYRLEGAGWNKFLLNP